MTDRISSEILDQLMNEIKSMREEFTLQIGKYQQIGELEDRIDDLEKRIKKIEDKIA